LAESALEEFGHQIEEVVVQAKEEAVHLVRGGSAHQTQEESVQEVADFVHPR
jgi:hypothetical protein